MFRVVIVSELRGLRFTQSRSSGDLFPLMGHELRDLFVTRITEDLGLLAIHLYCGRSPGRTDILRKNLSQSLSFFLDCYLPLVLAANHLCSLESDWKSDLKLLWQDLERLIAREIRGLHNPGASDESPPKGLLRIKQLDRNDPIGSVMLDEFEHLFPRVLETWERNSANRHLS